MPSTQEVSTGTNAVKFLRPLQLATWWNALSVPASKITGVLALARIPGLPASRTTSGTFAAARIPDLAHSKIEFPTISQANFEALATYVDGRLYLIEE